MTARVTKITLLRGPWEPDRREICVVSEPAALQELVATMKLRSKAPCQCLHDRGLEVDSMFGRYTVAFCDHCFDVVAIGWYVARYHMPKDLLYRLNELEQHHTKK